jgi:hypothetical protein
MIKTQTFAITATIVILNLTSMSFITFTKELLRMDIKFEFESNFKTSLSSMSSKNFGCKQLKLKLKLKFYSMKILIMIQSLISLRHGEFRKLSLNTSSR